MIPIKGKTTPVLGTNPQRPDWENTAGVRIKNIPLSADDAVGTRVLTLRGAEVINVTWEKLHVNRRLTNYETGDRLVFVKLPPSRNPSLISCYLTFFKARVIHVRQKTGYQPESMCPKYLQTGHKFNQCQNTYVCRYVNRVIRLDINNLSVLTVTATPPY